MIVGLTGGIATGKSTVTAMLRELGAYVVDADVWARKVVEPGSPGLAEIVDAFSADVLNADGSLNRKKLGSIVFTNDSARLALNAITHPRVRQGMKSETEQYLRQCPNQPVVWDVPLLFEGETRLLVDVTVLVYADADLQLTRLRERDHLGEADAKARIAAQMPIEEKRRLADYVIENTGSLEETKAQVRQVWQKLLRQVNRGCES